MDIQNVTEDFLARIESSRKWLNSGDVEMPEIFFRGKPWSLKAVEFLDNPGRVEQFGVAFLMSVQDSTWDFSIRLCIRLRPKPYLDSDYPEAPYVVTYVFDQARQQEDEVTHIYMPDWKSYSSYADLSLPDWYLKWINRMLKSENSRKVMQLDMRMGAGQIGTN